MRRQLIRLWADCPNGTRQSGRYAAGGSIVSIDGQAISGWMELVDAVRASEGRALAFGIDRSGQRLELDIAPVEMDGVLRVGILPRQPDLPPELFEPSNLGRCRQCLMASSGPPDVGADPGSHVENANWRPLDRTCRALLPLLKWRLLRRNRFVALLAFVAYLSVSLGVLNLLPIPVLDGGHLTWYAVEAIRGFGL